MILKKLLTILVLCATVTSICVAEEQLPLDFIKLKSGEGIHASLQFPGRCMQGDYDFIKEEIAFSEELGGAGLYLSTKPIGSKKEDSQTLISNTIPFYKLRPYLKSYSDSTKILSIKVPEGDDFLFTISICKGLTGFVECEGKDVWSYDNLVSAYRQNIHMAEGEPRDKIYFKQLLHKKGDKVYFSKLIIGDNNFPLFKSYLEKTFAPLYKNTEKKMEIEKDLADMRKLRSLPLRQNNNDTLIIRLPIYDQKRCIL